MMERIDPELGGNLDVEAFQAEISSLSGVRAARVVSTSRGRVSEIHLVADGHKPAKQIVRDVQTIASAQFGTDIDYRIVSVVQFNGQTIPAAPSGRPELRSITWTSEASHSVCQVILTMQGEEATGEARGTGIARGRPRMAAQAAMEALRDLRGDRWPVDLVDVVLQDVSGRKVALVVLVGLRGWGEETLVGSSIVLTDEADAVVRAVLDAFNRVVTPE